MLKKIYIMLVLLWLTVVGGLLFMITYVLTPIVDIPAGRNIEPIPEEADYAELPISTMRLDVSAVIELGESFEKDPEPIPFTDAELIAMAGVVHSEAGNQDIMGRRLIADVILNRLDSIYFPDTVMGVLTQANQFSAPSKAYTAADLLIVFDEVRHRTDYDIVFFRRSRFHKMGKPAYQYGDHYFSTLWEG